MGLDQRTAARTREIWLICLNTDRRLCASLLSTLCVPFVAIRNYFNFLMKDFS